MKEEKNIGSKKWSRIFRKKWFFPAVYLTVAALLLTFVVWYQNLENQIPDTQESQETADTATDPFDEDAQPVMEQQEVVKMPVSDQDQAEIVTKFYDYDADQKTKESALVLYNDRYYQSSGIDIAASGETFDVTAALSGTVKEVKEDPLLGNVVTLSHEDSVLTYYASLGEVKVKVGEDVKQGDAVGTAGQNLFGKEDGVHVHFEIRKDGKPVNPEDYFNEPVSKIQVEEKAEGDDKVSEGDSGEQSIAPEEDTTGTEEDVTGTEDDAMGTEENPTGTEEDSNGTEDDPLNQEEEMNPDDSTTEEDGSSNNGAE
ncbi:peptidoglycan DD-metalloendopeptidase family protein [Virgibacillus flavescens]|uniref:peptidoglycan DD-metalloendopeptidase family protein n=1 Tax=Virgibacillus flavescens TaxID=1611422 RepID=UPI003D34C5CF